MIDKLFDFLRDELNRDILGSVEYEGNTERPVKFYTEIPQNAIVFPQNSIVPVLLQVEQDKHFLPEDRYHWTDPTKVKREDKSIFYIQPALALNLTVIFVANWLNYGQTLMRLSQVIQFFQKNPYFQNETLNQSPEGIPEIFVEMIPVTLTMQNEIWNLLKAPYHPSVLYKIKLVMFEASLPTKADPRIEHRIVTDLTQDLNKAPKYTK